MLGLRINTGKSSLVLVVDRRLRVFFLRDSARAGVRSSVSVSRRRSEPNFVIFVFSEHLECPLRRQHNDMKLLVLIMSLQISTGVNRL